MNVTLLRFGFVALFATVFAALDARPQGEPTTSVAYVSGRVRGGGCLPSGCEWRSLRPAIGEDRLVLKLESEPKNVFWRDGFVFFRSGSRFYRAPWRAESASEFLFSLPFDDSVAEHRVSDIWRDRDSGAWKLTLLEFAHSSYVASLWERRGETWERVTSRVTECECGGCPCARVLDELVRPAHGRETLKAKLDGMRVEHRLREAGLVVDEGSDGRLYDFPSRFIDERATRARVEIGDTAHAMTPLSWVGPGGATRQLISERPAGCSSRQLGFEERAGYLLVASEYVGACALVVDMRTGATIATLGAESRFAVWLGR